MNMRAAARARCGFRQHIIVSLTPTGRAQPSPFPPRGAPHVSEKAVLQKLPIRFEPGAQKGTFLARGMGQGFV
jgi:hypothetical protein